MMHLPSLSIITVNYNDAKRLKTSLKSIRDQDYPIEKIEILILDGGSTDDSMEVAKKFNAIFIDGGFHGNQEARRGVGILKAKNEIIVYIDTDNYLPYSTWLKDMVQPLMEDKSIFASQTLWYAYRKKDTLFNRYCSLFGINDPVAFYLHKADRLTHYQKKWALKGEAEDRGKYYKATFKDDIPTVGANGFLIRREILLKEIPLTTKDDLERIFHIDVVYDLVRKGYKHIAFVKNDIIHDTSASLIQLLKKRINYYTSYAVKFGKNRRYKVFDPKNTKDQLLLLKYIIYSVTIIKPLLDAIKGFIKKPDIAWFVHPIACLAFAFAYGIAVVKSVIK